MGREVKTDMGGQAKYNLWGHSGKHEIFSLEIFHVVLWGLKVIMLVEEIGKYESLLENINPWVIKGIK